MFVCYVDVGNPFENKSHDFKGYPWSMPKNKLLLLLNILFNLSLKESRFICLLVFKDTVCIFIFAVKQDYEAIHNNNIPSSV